MHLNADFPHLPIVSQAMSWQPVHEAAHNGDVEKLKQLLKAKPEDVDLAGVGGSTPLLYAARFGKLEAVKCLVEHKATVNTANRSGQTALQHSCLAAHAEIAAFLLDNGAEIDERDLIGATALMWAVLGNEPKCVKLLLESKADTTASATAGEFKSKTALDIATRTEWKRDEIVELLHFASTAAPPPAPPAPRVESQSTSASDSAVTDKADSKSPSSTIASNSADS